jgi:hypothetical protein
MDPDLNLDSNPDSDADADPAYFASDLQDVKKIFKKKVFWLITL